MWHPHSGDDEIKVYTTLAYNSDVFVETTKHKINGYNASTWIMILWLTVYSNNHMNSFDVITAAHHKVSDEVIFVCSGNAIRKSAVYSLVPWCICFESRKSEQARVRFISLEYRTQWWACGSTQTASHTANYEHICSSMCWPIVEPSIECVSKISGVCVCDRLNVYTHVSTICKTLHSHK